MSSKIIYTSKYRKVWAIGDIHGGDKAFEQVLELSGFDNENDLLLFTGDATDGWPETLQVINRLMKIKNLVHILGNHDDWSIKFYDGKLDPRFSDTYFAWVLQGGQATIDSYPEGKMPAEHLEFLKSALHYCEIAEKEGMEPNKIITHGGFSHSTPVKDQDTELFCWNRDLVGAAYSRRKQKDLILSPYYTEIYVGHTPTTYFNDFYTKPQNWCGVWAIDTGACYTGKLSMIDISSKEVFQSDVVMKLYPDHKGRNGYSYNEKNKPK